MTAQSKPNKAHEVLAEMERAGLLKGIVTQNIDNLHTLAGTRKVLELHGNINRNYCMDCGKFYSFEDILDMDMVPRCECGGMIKPDVTLYEEELDTDTLINASAKSKLLQENIIFYTPIIYYLLVIF